MTAAWRPFAHVAVKRRALRRRVAAPAAVSVSDAPAVTAAAASDALPDTAAGGFSAAPPSMRREPSPQPRPSQAPSASLPSPPLPTPLKQEPLSPPPRAPDGEAGEEGAERWRWWLGASTHFEPAGAHSPPSFQSAGSPTATGSATPAANSNPSLPPPPPAPSAVATADPASSRPLLVAPRPIRVIPRGTFALPPAACAPSQPHAPPSAFTRLALIPWPCSAWPAGSSVAPSPPQSQQPPPRPARPLAMHMLPPPPLPWEMQRVGAGARHYEAWGVGQSWPRGPPGAAVSFPGWDPRWHGGGGGGGGAVAATHHAAGGFYPGPEAFEAAGGGGQVYRPAWAPGGVAAGATQVPCHQRPAPAGGCPPADVNRGTRMGWGGGGGVGCAGGYCSGGGDWRDGGAVVPRAAGMARGPAIQLPRARGPVFWAEESGAEVEARGRWRGPGAAAGARSAAACQWAGSAAAVARGMAWGNGPAGDGGGWG